MSQDRYRITMASDSEASLSGFVWKGIRRLIKPSPLAKRLAKRLIELGMTFSVDIEDLCIKRNQWAICNHRNGSEQFGWEFVDINGDRPTVTWSKCQCFSIAYGPYVVGGFKAISELVRCKYIDVYQEHGDERIEIIGANNP